MEKELPSNQINWIPQTKLIPPQVGEDILTRNGLLNQLFQAVTQKRLTLLSAPAGSGKTIIAASLGRAPFDLPLAWLALDEDDNDLATFMWVLVAALHRLLPQCGGRALALLTELQNPASKWQRILGVVINEVIAAGPTNFVLVIDDYHLIRERAIHEAVTFLLERIPANWHLLVATRHDPPLSLARLRARGYLEEFHLADLRFQEHDVRELFTQQLSMTLSPAEIKMLQTRSGGWIAGLRLLANSLQSIDDPEDRYTFISQYAAADRHVFDLLAEEVLNHQPPELRSFLLETSILSELSPGLCAAVTGRREAPQLLAEVHNRNLFLSAVGDYMTATSPVYRYHDLFASFLRHRLIREMPSQIKILHRRAAVAENSPARVVHHYLSAEAWDEAAQSIEKYGRSLLQEGQISRLQEWVMALPASVRQARPWLNYLLGMCYGESGDFVSAEPLLQMALHQFRDQDIQNGVTATLVALAYTSIGRHNFEQSVGLFGQVLKRPLSPYERVRAYINRAWLMVYQNNWSKVDADVATAMQIAFSSEDRGAINVLAHQLTTPLILGEMGISPIENYCRTILTLVGDEDSVARAGNLSLLSTIQLLHGDLTKAFSSAREARALSRQLGGFVWMDIGWDLVLLAEARIRADYAGFKRLWQARLPVYEHTAARQWLIVYLFLLGRALWLQNRGDELHQIARRANTTKIDFEPPESLIARQMTAALLALHEQRYPQAQTLLLEASARQQYARQIRIFFDASFLLAHLYQEWDRPDDALDVLRRVLPVLAQQNTPGFILQEGRYVIPLLRLAVEHDIQPAFVKKVLQLFKNNQDHKPIPIPNSPETLTPREVEVLQLLMTGATNKKIAENLVITTRTAKAHVSNILRKLEVASRTEAVIRANELSLLID